MANQRKRITSQTIHEVEKSISWARALQMTLDALGSEKQVDPVSIQITKAIDRWHWLPSVLLALTCSRFADLQKIKLEHILLGRPQTILQAKTKEMRTLPNLFLINESLSHSLDPTAKIMHSNYDSLRMAIQKAVPSHVRQVLKNQNDATHIFRHLRASFFKSRGWSVSEIKDFFQHKDEQATLEYIHEGLFEISTQNQK